MQLKAMRQKGDKVDVSHYRVNVNKLQARLNMECDTAKKRGHVKFDGWPKVSTDRLFIYFFSWGGEGIFIFGKRADRRSV